MPTPVVSVSHLGAAALEHRIGVQHQEAQLQKRIKVWEAVDLRFALYAQVVDTEVPVQPEPQCVMRIPASLASAPSVV